MCLGLLLLAPVEVSWLSLLSYIAFSEVHTLLPPTGMMGRAAVGLLQATKPFIFSAELIPARHQQSWLTHHVVVPSQHVLCLALHV